MNDAGEYRPLIFPYAMLRLVAALLESRRQLEAAARKPDGEFE